MGNFHYCFHKDELDWEIGDGSTHFKYRLNSDTFPAVEKSKLKKFIEEQCSGKVYCWPGVDFVRRSQQNWERVIQPNKIELYFEKEEDALLLILKYGKQE